MYREILTKAIIAKGEKEIKEIKTIDTKNNVSKVLGCWIINHIHNIKRSNQKIFIVGCYDAYFWYGYNDNSACGLFYQKFDFEDEIPYMFSQESSELNEQNEIKDYVLKQPACTSMKFDNTNITIEIERKYSIDIIGETKLRIKVDDVIIDEMINTDYVKNKK